MNITTYIKRHGERTFSELPFSPADSLILTNLTYLLFENIISSSNQKVAVCNLFVPSRINKLTDKTLYPGTYRKFIKAVSSAKRYKEIIIEDFHIDNSDSNIIQYASMTFRCDDFIYIGFRGTDITITGWKEDLYLALHEVIPSHTYGKKYIEKVIKKYEDSSLPIYIGGHSKGGNVAIYSSFSVEKKLQKRITKIFDHDGPGFKKDITSLEGYQRIEDKIERFIPANSIIGVLLNCIPKAKIVKCSAHSGINQHNPFKWDITKDGNFIQLSHNHKSSKAIKISLDNFYNSLTDEKLEFYINRVFLLFDTAKINTVIELRKHRLRLFKTFKRLFKKEDESVQKEIKGLVKSIIHTYLSNRFFRKKKKDEEK